MAKFVDAEGREWGLSLTLGKVKRLREECNFVLGKEATNTRLAETLFADPETLGRVLWVMIESEAKARDITPEAFANAIDCEALESATLGFMEAITDFFQRPEAAKTIKKRLPELLAETDKKLAEAANQSFDQLMLKNFAGNSPG